MAVSKEEYKKLKEYFDFQRKVEYNKEKLRKAVNFMLDDPEALFQDIWGKMKEEEMIEVPKDWVPENDNLKIEGEE